MPPKFAKTDRVKLYATRFDKEELEEGEQKFSEKWAADGNGIWCYGTVTCVYVKRGRKAQEYMIRYDNGESMKGMEEHIETARDDGESDNDSEEAKDNMNRSREDVVDPTDRCVQIRLGEKKIMTGINKGTSRAVQGRCTSCRARNKRFETKGRSPNTAWGCVCHPGLYFCKNKTCWAEHLRQVRIDLEIEMEI